jgi:uncharacterized damage-inducible protein DinB
MSPETLKIQLGYTHWILRKNCEDIGHEESLDHPPDGGNSLNWIVGHIVASRHHMMSLLNQQPIWSADEIKRFDRKSSPVTVSTDTKSLPDMMEIHAATMDRVREGLDRITPEQLAAKAPYSITNNKDETVGSLLAGLVFHEAYHTGQTSYWRRVMGKEPVVK